MKDCIIKNESIWRFITGKEFDERHHDRTPHNLMRDEIVIPKDRVELTPSSKVIIKLSDEARERRSKLTNTYVYSVDEYDSISFKLTLIDFEVEHSNI